MAGQEASWWSVRMVVELPVKAGLPDDQLSFPKFEDRIILLKAADRDDARAKGESFAADYAQTSSWKVRKIVDVREILDRELVDGSEVYSAFIAREWADALIKGGNSPLAEWKRQNPGKDSGDATVGEIQDAWDNRRTEA
jgi:hypothetical protein